MTLILEFQISDSIGEVLLKQRSGHLPRNHPFHFQHWHPLGLNKLVLFISLKQNSRTLKTKSL